MSIEINNESGIEIDEYGLAALGRWVLDALKINPLAELSVVLLDTTPDLAAKITAWLAPELKPTSAYRATHCAEEHVFLAPHHAFRHAGRAAGV